MRGGGFTGLDKKNPQKGETETAGLPRERQHGGKCVSPMRGGGFTGKGAHRFRQGFMEVVLQAEVCRRLVNQSTVNFKCSLIS